MAESNNEEKTSTLKVLEHHLFVATLQRRSILPYLPLLIEIFFLRNPSDRFASITETRDEISLIFDEESIKVFENFRRDRFMGTVVDDSFLECPTAWRAIMVPSTTRHAHNVHTMARILSDNNISIMYLTLCDRDLILVEEEKLQVAVECLHAQLESSSEQLEVSEDHLETEQVDNKQCADDNDMQVTILWGVQLQALKFTTIHSLQYYTKTLMEILLFHNRATQRQLQEQQQQYFISFTSFDEHNILIIDSTLLQLTLLRDNYMMDQVEILGECKFVAFRMDEGALGFEETGITSHFSGSVGKHTPILYQSTFLTDFCFVGEGFVKEAIQNLKKNCYYIANERE